MRSPSAVSPTIRLSDRSEERRVGKRVTGVQTCALPILIGRTPALEQTKDLALARCQLWMRRRRRLILEILHLAEDADHVAAAFERNGTHLRRDALAVGC